MKDVRSAASIITDIYEVLDKRFSLVRVARAVKLAIDDLNLYSSSQIGYKSDVTTVSDNMTVDIQPNWGSVTKVGRIVGEHVYILDRATRTPMTQERYKLQQTINKCANCTCMVNDNYNVDTAPASLPTAAEIQTQSVVICPQSTFYNLVGYPYVYGYYRPNYGQFEVDEANNRIFISGIPIGSSILIEHKILTDDSNYQLIPKAAFDVLFHKAQSYLEPNNTNHEMLYRQYKKRFDTLAVREKYSLEELDRALRGTAYPFS